MISKEIRSGWPVYGAAVIYGLVVAAAIYRHEPWADEAQSWLLARDSSLIELWTGLLHYEGSPGLWQTLLHGLIRLGMPYGGLNVTSGVIGLGAAWLLLRYAPLPLAIRLTLPFTFFLCYQYSVVARSYDLLPLLLFGCAIIYKDAGYRYRLFTVLLLLMAAVSVHGLILSFSIWLGFHVTAGVRWADFTTGAAYVVVVIAIACLAWPAGDVTFVGRPDFSFHHFIDVTADTYRQAFTGRNIPSMAVLALSIPFLWRGRGFFIFVLSSTLLCAVGAIVYTHVWHQGLVFLAWLFAIWISANCTKPTAAVMTALLIVIGFQCYWTVRSVAYDWNYPYSGSREAASFLHRTYVLQRGLYGIGFSSTAIQPYFPENLFANWGGGKGPAFWDWSSRNHANDAAELLSSAKAGFVIVGYKATAEKLRWETLLKMAGYQSEKHFDGNLFWRTEVLEPESFDLYRRGGGGSTGSSVVNVADPATANQLISGFHGVENSGWRWTARKFSVALKRPAEASQHGATLVLRLVIPDRQIQRLGPMTLSADIAGHAIEPQTFSAPGSYVYSRNVPADALPFALVPVSFSFDKALEPSGADARELGAVVTLVALQPKP